MRNWSRWADAGRNAPQSGPASRRLRCSPSTEVSRHAVVVRFSKSRGRYERQGLLLEPQALAEVQRNLAQQGVMSVGKAYHS